MEWSSADDSPARFSTRVMFATAHTLFFFTWAIAPDFLQLAAARLPLRLQIVQYHHLVPFFHLGRGSITWFTVEPRKTILFSGKVFSITVVIFPTVPTAAPSQAVRTKGFSNVNTRFDIFKSFFNNLFCAISAATSVMSSVCGLFQLFWPLFNS